MANYLKVETKHDVKIIPKDSQVQVNVDAGVSAGTQVNVDVLPDEGYVFEIAYFRIVTTANLKANIVLYTKNDEQTLLKDDQDVNQDNLYDASDWVKLSGIIKFSVMVTVQNDLSAAETVNVYYSGRMVRV